MANYLRLNEGVTLSQTLTIMSIVFLVLFMLIAVPFYTSYRQKQTMTKLRQVHSLLVQTSLKYTLENSQIDEYETDLNIEDFVNKYYRPYLPVEYSCDKNQDKCWNQIQYTDLRGRKFSNKIDYSLVLTNRSVIGFGKDKNNLIYLIVDVDGKVGKNRLGRDVFVFYLYNKKTALALCPEVKDSEKYIAEGLHFGAWDKCGVPHDIYTYNDLYSSNVEDGCNKKAPYNPLGLGVGAGCNAIVKHLNWTIDKIYPW